MLSTSPLEAYQQKPLAQVSPTSAPTAAASSTPAQKVNFLLQMADRFEKDGNVTEAIKSAETALLVRKAMNGGQEDEFAEPMHKQALSVIQKCNGIAVGEFQSNRYDSALFLLNKALFLTSAAADTNCFGMHEHDRLRLRAATLNNLGCLEKRRENVKESLDYLQSAVEIETLVDPDVGASPSTCLNLCTLFNKIGKHDEAVAAAERAVTALHFQAQQGLDNIPQLVNMLMVAHYNLGVSVECANAQGAISKAIDAYARVVDIHKEHGRGQPSPTADAAADALRRLRAQQVSFPVGMPNANGSLPPIKTSSSTPTARNSFAAPPSLKALAPLAGFAPTITSPRPNSERMPRPPPGMGAFGLNPRPQSQPSMSQSAPDIGQSQLKTLEMLKPIKRDLSTSDAFSAPRRVSITPATSAVLESAVGLGSAAMKHTARMQSKNRKKEEATERAAQALVRAQKAHKRDKETQLRKEEELEAKRRDDMAEVLYGKMIESMRAEEVRRTQQAACKISATWRGYITRKYLLILTYSTIKIQALVRSALCRIRIAAEKEEARRQEVDAAIHFKRTKAAIVIQTHVRRFLRRLAIIRRYKARRLREYHSAKNIQLFYRSYQQQKREAVFRRIEAERRQQEYELERVNTAAAKIQGMFRTFKSRRFARLVRSEQQRRVAAAVTIQAQIRGCLTRQWFKHYRLYRREQEMSSAASIRSITKIQRVWRVALAKMRLTSLRNAALLKHRERQLNKAALVIQCAYRCHVAWCIVKPMRDRQRLENKSAVAIQSAYRGFKAREMYKYQQDWRRKIVAATKIQRWVRAVQDKLKQRRERRAGFQKKLADRQALKRTAAAMCIQTYCYTAMTRKVFMATACKYLHRAQQTAIIQSVGRRYLATKDMLTLKRISALVAIQEKHHAEMTQAALIIQRAVRMYQAKSALDRKRRSKSAAIVIQSAWRMYKAKQVAYHMRAMRQQKVEHEALATIQRVGRSYLQHLELKRLEEYHLKSHQQKLVRLRREEAATQIQAMFRGSATRTAVNEARNRLKHTVIETMRIQRAWRAYKCRSSINAHIAQKVALKKERNQAATKIQSFWRMVLAKEYVGIVRERRFYHTICAITIQCAWRCHQARQELRARKAKREAHQQFLAVQHDGWVQAVTVVAMHARTVLDQRLRLELTEKDLHQRLYQKARAKVARVNMAATKIQSRYRGYYERSYVRGLRREKMERDLKIKQETERARKAAEVIQRAFRSMLARVEANKRRALRRIENQRLDAEKAALADPKDIVKQLFWQHEAMLNKNLVKSKEERHALRYNAAAKIQSVARMYIARKAYKAERERLSRLKAHELYERQLAAKEAAQRADKLVRDTAAATRIQAIARMYLVRKAAASNVVRKSIVEEERRDEAAIKIQSAWRGYQARCLSARLAQEKNEQKDAVTYYEAARMIQKFYRGHMVRKRLETIGVVKRRMSLRARPPSVARPPGGSRPPTGTFRRASLVAQSASIRPPPPGLY